MTSSPYRSVAFVAEHCGVSERTVRRWLAAGLKHYKPNPTRSKPTGVLIRLDVGAFLERYAVERSS